ncbi:hypothetical protein [Parafilimonas terrae]|uniref:Uncharacterized protein n=1 Tax=Parafilimonas terrae TaxID=1465490 RepID=A0A1I5Z7G5_9BACT|nr:hypothetical protein [Parafilimonas terrae]SFQ52412.1 hypothetical protein SAMN05444277_11751 [Parafilimonas terrae]
MQCNCNKHITPLKITENKQGKKKAARRGRAFIEMAVPAFVFMLIPKCPVCLAGYIALATGAGISLTTATYMRIGLIIACVASLVYFVFKQVSKYLFHN